MFNLDTITTKNDNKSWPYRMLIIGPSGSGKTKTLLNRIQQDNNNLIDKISLCTKDLDEPKHHFLIKKRENGGIKNVNDPNTMDDGYNNIDDYNSKRKRKILIVFDDMISHIMSDKKAQYVLKELFIRCRKLNISVL